MGEEERTLPATPRRRAKERERGNVPRSTEVNSVLVFFVCIILLVAIGGKLASGILSIFDYFLGRSGTLEVSSKSLNSIVSFSVESLDGFFIPFFISIVLIGMASTFVLGGIIYAPKALAIKWGALNPIAGIKRLFSVSSFFTLGKSVLKLLLVGSVAYIVIKHSVADFLPIVNTPVESQVQFLAKSAFKLTLYISLAFTVIAAGDYYFQRWNYEKSIRMSPWEVKEEQKQLEGPPEIRRRIRAKQLEIRRRRLMKAVEEATVIITNPVELAVAVKYEPKVNNAPLVVAKGGGVIAKKIKEIATKYGVPIVENKELARLLFRLCKIGDEIPVKLYRAVAEVIAYVYKLKQRIKS